jgi:hypothetical protein
MDGRRLSTKMVGNGLHGHFAIRGETVDFVDIDCIRVLRWQPEASDEVEWWAPREWLIDPVVAEEHSCFAV